jgi:hypothetical protein
VDPPPPPPLPAPIITSSTIHAITDIDWEIHETVTLQWIAAPDSSLSVISFKILRVVASLPLPLLTKTSIDSLNTLLEPVAGLTIPDRTAEQSIIYRIFAIDSLDRSGDTSVACTLIIARAIPLLLPQDTLMGNQFKWEIPNGIPDQTRSCVILWHNGLLLWKSADVMKYTNGLSETFSKYLPDSLVTLPSGIYYWGVHLTIEGGTFPESFTIRKFYVH